MPRKLDPSPSKDDNLLLAALPGPARERLNVGLELVEMPRGAVIVEAFHCPQYLYFPVTAVVSLIKITLDGHSTDVALVGREGVVGFESLAPGKNSNCRTVTRCAGYGYRIRAELAQAECEYDNKFMKLLLDFVQLLGGQISQTALCNRFHPARQQICRQILLMMDRTKGSELKMTQELLSAMVGVRRETVSEVDSDLQNKGIIKYRRGLFSILNRQKLEDSACECYELLRSQYANLAGSETWAQHMQEPLKRPPTTRISRVAPATKTTILPPRGRSTH